jgi:hypothetical protein
MPDATLGTITVAEVAKTSAHACWKVSAVHAAVDIDLILSRFPGPVTFYRSQRKWWLILLACAGFVAIVGISARFCGAAIRSLSGDRRTSREHPESIAADPKRIFGDRRR